VAGTGAAADGALTSEQVLILGIGTTLGVVVQALILIPVLRRVGYRFTPRFDWRDAGLGRAGGLALWTIGLVLVNQATYLVVTRLATQANVNASASDAIAAGLTTYQKAHLVFVLPHSVITVSIVTAMLPALSRLAHDGRLQDVGRSVASTMRIVAALITPIAAVLVACGASIAILLFGYGAATTAQAGLMGLIVSVFMIGLIPFTLFYVLLRGFYALEDTRTPFVITIVFSAFWLVLAVPTFQLVPAGGSQVAVLALTYGISYWLALVIAWVVLARRLGGLESARTAWSVTRMIGAGLIATGIMIGVQALLLPALADTGRWGLLASTIVTAIVGGIAYLLLAWLLRVHETAQAIALVRRRVARRPAVRSDRG
jgi:putative peptidoglycan lipid II flippase